MARARTTIADVAREAGVSKGLVSFALNDRPGVASETRERILSVADRLGWRPNLRARSLSTNRAFAIGLVIARDPDIIAGDPFFPAFIAGLESALAPADMSLVLSMVADEEAEAQSYRQLVENDRVDGVILTDLRHDDMRIALVEELHVRAVTLGEPVPAARTADADASSVAGGMGPVASALPAVSLDDGPGIRAAVAHLADLGHRRIAHVAGPQRMLHGTRRRESFAAALRERDLADDLIVETDFTAADGARATRELLELAQRPTAIVYANDPMAIAGIGVAQRLGFAVPGDLSVTGFDGSDVGEWMHPALTTVTTAVSEWGRESALTLLRLIEHGSAASFALPPAHLVIRESTASPATASPATSSPTAP